MGGHNPPIIVRPDGSSTVPPQTDGIALGIMPDVDFAQNEITLSPGDILVLYTDGVTEAMNSRGEEFEMDRLRAVFCRRAMGRCPPRKTKRFSMPCMRLRAKRRSLTTSPA